MKYIILAMLWGVCSGSFLFAQSADNIILQNVNIEKCGDNLHVNFQTEIGKKITKRNYKLVLTPVLYKDSIEKRLKQIVVETRKTKIVDARQRFSAKDRQAFDEADEYRTRDNSAVDYSVRFPYEEWMEGSRLRMDRLLCGCCTEAFLDPMKVTDQLAFVSQVEEVSAEPEIIPELPVVKKWEFSRKDMVIDFVVSKTNIDLNLFENKNILDEMLEALQTILQSPVNRIEKIEITGYASPEGKYAYNKWLADQRSVALKNYLEQQVPSLSDSLFSLRNEGENWKRLREMVEASDMKYKDEVLYIIDNVPEEINYATHTSRKKQLMDLKGGIPYRYMMKNFFPRLRNACYIGVYYIGKGGE